MEEGCSPHSDVQMKQELECWLMPRYPIPRSRYSLVSAFEAFVLESELSQQGIFFRLPNEMRESSQLFFSPDNSVTVVCKNNSVVTMVVKGLDNAITKQYPLPIEAVGMSEDGSRVVIKMKTERKRARWEWFKGPFLQWCAHGDITRWRECLREYQTDDADDALVFTYEYEVVDLSNFKQLSEFLSGITSENHKTH